jgi:AraC-like DNA-binding protein
MSRSAPASRHLPELASIRAVVLQPVLAHFAPQPAKLRALMEQNGLNPALVQDPYAPVPLTSYLGLFEDAARAAGDPMLGAKLGHAIRPGDLGPVGLLVAQAGSIGQALASLARFTAALQSNTTAALLRLNDLLIWSYRIETSPALARRQDSEFTLGCVCGLIRGAFDPRWRPVEIHFEHGSAGHDAALEKRFGAPIRFGQAANRVMVRAAEAALPWRQEDRDLIGLIERHLSDLIAVGGEASTMAEQVSSLIRLYMGVRPTDLETLAAGLKIPPRSLQRRLAEEGVSIRELTQRHRMQMATTLLSEGGMSIEAIAAALGYADGTAFWRAHKKWTGFAPGEASSKKGKYKKEVLF